MGLWLARNKDGKLLVFSKKPRFSKYHGQWWSFGEGGIVMKDLFPEVTCENSPVELVPKMVDKSQTKYCGSYTTTTSVDNKNRR